MLVSGNSIYVGDSAITKVYQGEDLVWPTTPPPSEPDWLTFTILSGGTIKNNHEGTQSVYMNAQYSKNGNEWKTFNSSLSVEAGDVIRLRGEGSWEGASNYYWTELGNPDRYYANNFSGSTAVFDISGSLLSMEYGSGFTGQTETAMPDGGFRQLFKYTNVHSAKNLILPQTQSGTSNSIFYGFFEGCSSLTSIPVISNNVFNMDCRSMFEECSSLNYIKCLAESDTTINCTYWTRLVSPTGTFVKSANATWVRGINGIPNNWTIINE